MEQLLSPRSSSQRKRTNSTRNRTTAEHNLNAAIQRDKLYKSNGLHKDLAWNDFANVYLGMRKTCADNYVRCFRLVEGYPRLQNLNCSFTMSSKNAVAITSLFKMDAEYEARWR